MRRLLVALAVLVAATLSAQAAVIDAMGVASGSDTGFAIGLDIPSRPLTVAMRLGRLDLDNAYETSLSVAGEYRLPSRRMLAVYASGGASLVFHEGAEEVTVTRKGCRYNAEVTSPDESAVALLGGLGMSIPVRGQFGLQVEALYRVFLHSDLDDGPLVSVGATWRVPR